MRDYDQPDPDRVVRNIARVLQQQDLTLLSPAAYKFLINHCGFIAHYDYGGFVETYREDLPSFIEGFLNQMGRGWAVFLDNPHSYLYQVSYKGKVLAEIIRELIPLFENARGLAKSVHDARVKSEKLRRLEALAQEMGYQLVRKS